MVNISGPLRLITSCRAEGHGKHTFTRETTLKLPLTPTISSALKVHLAMEWPSGRPKVETDKPCFLKLSKELSDQILTLHSCVGGPMQHSTGSIVPLTGMKVIGTASTHDHYGPGFAKAVTRR